MLKAVKKLAIRLLLGWKNEGFCDIVSLGGKPYLVNIHLYEPADKFVDRMEKALQKQGLKS